MKILKKIVIYVIGIVLILSLLDVIGSNTKPTKAADSWSTGTAGGTARTGHTSVLSGEKIYSWGGYSHMTYFNSVSIYNIPGDSWSFGTAGGTARAAHTSVLYSGSIYSWGGYDATFTPLSSMDIYNIDSGSWTSGATYTARYDHTSVLYNGKIYSWGGVDGAGTYLDTVAIYDIASDSWSTGTSGGTARIRHKSALYNGKIYSWGGMDGKGNYLNSMDIYNIASDSWSTGTAGGTARSSHGSAEYNGRIYYWGGMDGNPDFINSMDIYDIANDSWSTGTAGGTGRTGHTFVSFKYEIYGWGGDENGDGDAIDTLDIYGTGIQPVYDNLPGDNRPINLDEGQVVTTPNYNIEVKPQTGSGITEVEFYVDSDLICTDTTADSEGVYSCDWDTAQHHSAVEVITNYENNDPITMARNVTVNIPSSVSQNTIAQGTTIILPDILPETGANNKNQNILGLIAGISSLAVLILTNIFLKNKKSI